MKNIWQIGIELGIELVVLDVFSSRNVKPHNFCGIGKRSYFDML